MNKMRNFSGVIKTCQKIAAAKGGRCISPIMSPRRMLEFECAEGHQWSASPFRILDGHWCSQCDSLSRFREIAASNGGRCLSTTYTNVHQPLEFECAQGHRWQALPRNIAKGVWCPECPKPRSIRRTYSTATKEILEARGHQVDGYSHYTCDDFQAIAATRGGQCLSSGRIKTRTRVSMMCAEGHVWESRADHILKGHWCPKCAGKENLTIDEIRRAAEARGGRCLSAEYLGDREKLEFECALGHKWEATGRNVLKKGSWCPDCAGKRKLTLESFQEIATAKGGRCLSSEYISSVHKLEFECARGHRWHAKAITVRNGSWCRSCAYDSRRRDRDGQTEE